MKGYITEDNAVFFPLPHDLGIERFSPRIEILP